jgi:hypothetical protein
MPFAVANARFRLVHRPFRTQCTHQTAHLSDVRFAPRLLPYTRQGACLRPPRLSTGMHSKVRLPGTNDVKKSTPVDVDLACYPYRRRIPPFRHFYLRTIDGQNKSIEMTPISFARLTRASTPRSVTRPKKTRMVRVPQYVSSARGIDSVDRLFGFPCARIRDYLCKTRRYLRAPKRSQVGLDCLSPFSSTSHLMPGLVVNSTHLTTAHSLCWISRSMSCK